MAKQSTRRTDAPQAPTAAEVRAWREARGLTQTAAATLAGVSARMWQYYEDGSVSIHPNTWLAIMAAGSGRVEEWLARAHPEDRIHGGEKRLTWEMRQLLIEAYRAGQMSRV